MNVHEEELVKAREEWFSLARLEADAVMQGDMTLAHTLSLARERARRRFRRLARSRS
jgi:hypothetical protein